MPVALFVVLLSLLLLLVVVLPLFACNSYIAADAALKEEHVIDGRTIDVKRAVPRDRAPQPRLVRDGPGPRGTFGGLSVVCKAGVNLWIRHAVGKTS